MVFFRNVPAEIHLEEFCNWGVRAVSDWPDLVGCQPNNINLLAQLRQHKPELVIGQGHFTFVIARDPKVIQVFRVLVVQYGNCASTHGLLVVVSNLARTS